jgi:hypothetical protein
MSLRYRFPSAPTPCSRYCVAWRGVPARAAAWRLDDRVRLISPAVLPGPPARAERRSMASDVTHAAHEGVRRRVPRWLRHEQGVEQALGGDGEGCDHDVDALLSQPVCLERVVGGERHLAVVSGGPQAMEKCEVHVQPAHSRDDPLRLVERDRHEELGILGVPVDHIVPTPAAAVQRIRIQVDDEHPLSAFCESLRDQLAVPTAAVEDHVDVALIERWNAALPGGVPAARRSRAKVRSGRRSAGSRGSDRWRARW